MAKVIVPVDDQAKALQFWTETVASPSCRTRPTATSCAGTRYALGQW
ncbi:MAG: hypothetical protein ACRDRZ_05405 [Pseudonocardiaceae bacterium]